mmetsp:Transcript_11724/g.21315  ORF Transcript_11724/g.21315 Transcript_11724/m.21315 type:complete len:329 (+) Transcript_11724:47-1033(+)
MSLDKNQEEIERLRRCALSGGSLPGVTPIRMVGPLAESVVEAYLSRLRVPRPDVATRQALEVLTAAHLERIAYDNLDIHTGRTPAPLDMCAGAERVAHGGRGGYCFTAAGAFAALLYSLGFEVSLHMAAVGPDPAPGERWGNHVVLVVHFREQGVSVVADCGLGEGPCQAFELVDHEWEEAGSTFALEKRDSGKWWFTNAPGHSFPGFTVDLSSSCASCEEFRNYHDMFWTHPESNYVKSGVVVHRPDMEGVLTLRACTLRRAHPDLAKESRTIRTITDREDWFRTLENDFHMDLGDLTAAERDHLWARVASDHSAWMAKRFNATASS